MIGMICGYECENRGYVGWSLSIVDKTEAKEMCSVSVSRSKVSRLLVADRHWKYGVLYFSRPILNGLTRYLGTC